MEMSGEYLIEAPIQTVWDAINNPEILQASIPGCEELTKDSDTEMSAKVALKIGPVKARFAGAVTLQNLNEPNGLEIVGEGKGGVAGFAKGGATVQLAEEGDNTRLTYEATAQVGGKIAQLGSRLIKSTASKLADKFFANLRDQLTEGDA